MQFDYLRQFQAGFGSQRCVTAVLVLVGLHKDNVRYTLTTHP